MTREFRERVFAKLDSIEDRLRRLEDDHNK